MEESREELNIFYLYRVQGLVKKTGLTTVTGHHIRKDMTLKTACLENYRGMGERTLELSLDGPGKHTCILLNQPKLSMEG